MSDHWHFVEGQTRHPQDGCMLALLMKGIGHGRRPVFAVDVGCGDGIIAFDIFRHRRATKVLAVDSVEACCSAAKKNLSPYIEKGVAQVLKMTAARVFRDKNNWGRFDRFVINPPFFVKGSGESNRRALDQSARHEVSLSLKIWSRGARKLLKTGGELYCVFPTERFGELVTVLSLAGVEPKEVWWFKADRRKRRVFVRAVKGARPGIIFHFDHEADL